MLLHLSLKEDTPPARIGWALSKLLQHKEHTGHSARECREQKAFWGLIKKQQTKSLQENTRVFKKGAGEGREERIRQSVGSWAEEMFVASLGVFLRFFLSNTAGLKYFMGILKIIWNKLEARRPAST